MHTTLAKTSILAILSYVLILAPLSRAEHTPRDGCDSDDQPALGIVQVGSGRADDPVPTFYVDDRNFVTGNGLWIYMECNGKDGLQRGGSSPFVPDDNEICNDDPTVQPDCHVF